MDDLQKEIWTWKFRNAVSDRSGQAYEDFFTDIMRRRHKDHFEPAAAWGRHGDLKCDGFLHTDKSLFAVHAPEKLEAAGALRKINEDYAGAAKHWGDLFEKWRYVYRELKGLPAPITHKLVVLTSCGRHHCTGFGPEELRRTLFETSDDDIAEVLGTAPTIDDMLEIGMPELEEVLEAIEASEPVSGSLDKVSPYKLKYSGLSEAAAGMLQHGMMLEKHVGDYFDGQIDPARGDAICNSFHDAYMLLRTETEPLEPDDIFRKLMQKAGGEKLPSPKRYAAVLAVLAYLFQRCDIFENVPDGDI